VCRLTQAVPPHASPLQLEIRRVRWAVTRLSSTMGVVFFAQGSLQQGLQIAQDVPNIVFADFTRKVRHQPTALL